jgi:hypothetical protein
MAAWGAVDLMEAREVVSATVATPVVSTWVGVAVGVNGKLRACASWVGVDGM